jgi:hypothetical protein
VDSLTSLPVGVLVVASLLITMSIALGSRFGVRALVPAAEYDHVQHIAAPLMPALGGLFGILMALTLASEAGYLKAAQDEVSAEAAAASRLAWASTSPGVDSDAIQAAMDEYLMATRSSEWNGDDAAKGDPGVAISLASLERVVRAEAAGSDIGSPAGTELLASLDALTTSRRERIAAASRQLPLLYVLTLVTSGVALIANAGALGLRNSVRTSLLVLGLASVVGLSIALLFTLSAPWRGGLLVSGEPIDSIIRDVQSKFFSSS